MIKRKKRNKKKFIFLINTNMNEKWYCENSIDNFWHIITSNKNDVKTSIKKKFSGHLSSYIRDIIVYPIGIVFDERQSNSSVRSSVTKRQMEKVINIIHSIVHEPYIHYEFKYSKCQNDENLEFITRIILDNEVTYFAYKTIGSN